MPKAINIGEMKAYFDVNTGFIRLTSSEKGSDLKKNGFVVNITPGSKEYEMLLDSIIGGNSAPETKEHKVPKSVMMSNKYRSDDYMKVPLGLNIGNMESDADSNDSHSKDVFYWDIKNTPHMMLEGHVGSGRLAVIESILDHAVNHSQNIEVLSGGVYTEYASTWIKEALNITHYSIGDSQILHDAHSEMSRRLMVMQENNWDTFSDTQDKMMCVILGEFEGLLAVPQQDDKRAIEENRIKHILYGNLLRAGRAAGIHVITSTRPYNAMYVTGENKSQMAQEIRMKTSDKDGSIQADVFTWGKRSAMIPFYHKKTR